MTMKKTVLLLLTAFTAVCIIFSSCSGTKDSQTADPSIMGSESTVPSAENGSGENESGSAVENEPNSIADVPSPADTTAGAQTEQTLSGAQTDGNDSPLVSLLQNTVDVLAVKEYSGRFIENGKVETVKNVLCVTLKNKGTDDIRLLDFEVSDGAKTYAFSVTTLFSGDSVTVAEKNGETVSRDFKAKSIKVTRAAYFDAKPSLNADVFELDCSDGVINIKNISDSDISDGYIYYKEFSGSGYFGGITYRIKTGEIKSGETKQLSVPGFDAKLHKAVFTTYVR